MIKLEGIVKRHFTTALEGTDKTVYDLFNWKSVDVVLNDYKSGKVLTDMKGLEFPVGYSQNACDIIASKYFRRAGVPNSPNGAEFSMRQVVHRLVGFWTASALDEGLIDETNMGIFYDELAYGMLAQMWAPNSPQWFNTGLKWAYDISKGPEGHYYYDLTKGKVIKSKDAYTRTQGSACFIVSITDALLGKQSLTDQIITETLLFKHGSGTGSNFSPIRGLGEKLSGGGTSSGLMSFLKVFDRNAGAIKSGGTTRRAAKMVSLDIDHPEILEFINWKSKEEDKVVALGKMGYDTDFNGEAYETVSGQNSNNSLFLTNEFLDKVDGNDPDPMFELKGRVDSSINKMIDARHVFREWNYAAWRSGDPAPQYGTTINEWHTCPAGEDGNLLNPYNWIRASNPCSEYFFLQDSACNLASINVTRFYDIATGKFNIASFIHLVGLIQLVLEATIHWGQFPTEEIARRTHLFRTTGLGLANTGGLNMLMAQAYDSDEARANTAALTGLMTGHSYFVSALMAEKVGAFEKFELNRPHMLRVIRNHARVVGAREDAYEGLSILPMAVQHEKITLEGLSEALVQSWINAEDAGEAYGYRNAQVTVIAPTGTIAFAMDCDSTSTEPFFSHVAYKKLSGGGFMEIVNPLIQPALEKLGYAPNEVQDIMNYVLRKETVTENGYSYDVIADGKIEGAPHLKEEHYPIFDTANSCGTGVRAIEPMGHVRMMAALTPLVSGAISKTVNLPRTATVEDFEQVHLEAWKMGVKAIALYRDGCKASQPLNSTKNSTKKALEDYTYAELQELVRKQQDELSKPKGRKRPNGIRASRVHEAHIGGLKLYITLSFDSDTGELAEVYATADRQGSMIGGLLDSLSKMISKQLQYGVPAGEIAKSLRGQKYEPAGFVSAHPYIKRADSLSDLISKIIDIELGNFSYCQVKPDSGAFLTHKQILDLQKGLPAVPVVEVAVESKAAEAVGREVLPTEGTEETEEVEGRVYGQTCPTCSSDKMKKNGTCYVCLNCGSTTGCS